MTKKIVISRFNNIAAVLHNNKTQEIIAINDDYQVNDIYLGSVNKIFSSINAAFINLGNNQKSGFIHINDIKSLKKTHNLNNIADILSVNQIVIVQVIKEPTLNKGPRLTANINLFGRYLVLMPFCNTTGVSRQVYDDNERAYLHALAVLLKPSTMGLIVRASAKGVNEKALLEDFRLLKQQWYFIQKAVISNPYPSLLYKDEDLIKRIVRDFYEESIQKIIIDSADGLKKIKYYLNKWQCISSNQIKLQLFASSECILEEFNINQSISEALKPKVKLSLGGYIFIESYEALTVIDVNSGSFNKSDNSRETVLRMNCYAATEIAYQLRIRNINGVVIVDFIDMQSYKDQLQLLEHFSGVLSYDNAKPQIIQLSELGLVELTRRRRGQTLFELFNKRKLGCFDMYANNIFASSFYSVKNNSILYKNINALFFKKNFPKYIKIPKQVVFSKNKISIHNSYSISLLHLRYAFIVPLVIYSEIIDINL